MCLTGQTVKYLPISDFSTFLNSWEHLIIVIDLMVLAKSLSSLTDTQMINKLDHAKSEKEEKRKRKEGEKEKEWGRKNKTQREGKK